MAHTATATEYRPQSFSSLVGQDFVSTAIKNSLNSQKIANAFLLSGPRGVGKTTFLLQYAKEKFGYDSSCLYINMNNLYFQGRGIAEFAGDFQKMGGKVLLIDQVFKHPDWSNELRLCYDLYPNLKIVFTGSSVMRLKEENHSLNGIVKSYNLRGFSFREYLCIQTKRHFRSYTLEEIIQHHASISREICEQVKPLDFFEAYLHHGYYPSYLESKSFEVELLKTMNTQLEVDVLMIKQIDVACLHKLRKLLYILMREAPCALNVSSISEEIGLSRATTMNYIKYLKDSRLINLLYLEHKNFPMKPSKVFMQNTNLAQMIFTRELSPQDMYETFFYTSVHGQHKVNATERNAMFVVDGKYYFDVRETASPRDTIRPTAIGEMETGRGNMMPLWLLGFLY